jgi:hypothetical protein
VLLSTPAAVAVNGTINGLGGILSESVNFALIKGFLVGTGVGEWPGGGPSIGLISICFSWEFTAECNWSRVGDGVLLGGPLRVLGERLSNSENISCSWLSSKTSSKAMSSPSLLGESIGTVLTDTLSKGVSVTSVSISPRVVLESLEN